MNHDVAYFLAVADAGSLARAAERLSMTQPALSKALQRIEQQVGVKLLSRSAQGSTLTEAGRAFYTRMRAVTRDAEDAMQEARDLGGGHAGWLRIGATPAAANFTLSALLPSLQQERPAATISFWDGFSDTLLEALAKRELDLAVGPLLVETDTSMDSEILFDDPYSLVLNRNHPLAGRDDLTLEDLVACAWVASPKREYARQFMEMRLQQQGLPRPKIAIEVNSMPALLLAVSRTTFVSLINSRALMEGQLPPNVVVQQVLPSALRCPVGMVWRRGYVSSIAQRAQQLLRRMA
ncbi:LysR family transcriptional regulator [Oxalobacteraceae bacterium OTU3CINTB1]|nr:LysR family transcriptional regulator [Oxalobacteraceae bacterium OTU3CINTB1]